MDLLKAIAEDQGFQYEISYVGYNQSLDELENRAADAAIGGIALTGEKTELFDLSNPYFESGLALGVVSTDTKINGYEQLASQKVAVLKDSQAAEYAESIADKYKFEVIPYPEAENVYEAVRSGKTAACIENYPVLGYDIKQENGLRMAGEKVAGSSFGLAVIKGENQEFLDMFNAGLEHIKEDGTYEEILNRYISEG